MKHFRDVEFRFNEKKRTLAGVLMSYGDVAPRYQERMEPHAFGKVEEIDVVANLHHDPSKPIAKTRGGGLSLSDNGDELRFELAVPDTTDGRDALALIESGIITGASVEFFSKRERMEGQVRVIESAELVGFGLVTRPAYKKTNVAARENKPKPMHRLGGIL